MNVRERLKEAYENVSYNADKTWSDAPTPYHESNMELYLTEQYIRGQRLVKVRPRTVRDCIPQSRLAQYSNFEYNESREMSYACDFCNFDATRIDAAGDDGEEIREVWETPEVDELYGWFKKNVPEDNCSRLEESCYESPLLKVNGFEDRILKIQITEDRVKNIWRSGKFQDEKVYKSCDVFVNVYMTPIKNFYLVPKSTSVYRDLFRENYTDFEQLERLSQSITAEIDGISRYLEAGLFERETAPITTITSESSPSTEILYSEVLQGLAPSRKHQLSSLKSSDVNNKTSNTSSSKSLIEDSKITTLHQDCNFTNYTVLSSHRLNVNAEASSSSSSSISKKRTDDTPFINPKPDHVRYLQNSVPKVVQNLPTSRIDTAKFASTTTNCNSSINRTVSTSSATTVSGQTENINVHTFSRYRYPNNNQCFIDRHTRNAFNVHPFSTSCIQQTYFYSPVPPVQRWLHPSFSATSSSCYPTQIFTSSWISQNQVMSQGYDVNRIFGATPAGKINSERSSQDGAFAGLGKGSVGFVPDLEAASTSEVASFREEIVEIESFVKEHQVSASVSEELEIQALEQYSNSNENFYQELEKEAAEQYASSSE